MRDSWTSTQIKYLDIQKSRERENVDVCNYSPFHVQIYV